MTQLALRELAGKRLRQVTASLEPGLHVLHAIDPTGTDELIPLLDGSSLPRRGTVRFGGRCPHREPELRQHIGSLWSVESLPEARTVRASLARLALPQSALDAAEALLERLGHASLLSQSPRELEPPSTRIVALAVALSKPKLELLLLHEPLLSNAGDDSSIVAELILSHAVQIPVLVVTASRATAHRLGGPSAELGGGFWRRLPPGGVARVTLRIAGTSLRQVAAEIVRRPLVHALRVTTHAEGYDELWLETLDQNSVSLDLVRAAQQLGAQVWSMDTLVGSV